MPTMTQREIRALEIAIALDEEEKEAEVLRIQLERKLNELDHERKDRKKDKLETYKREHPALWHYGCGRD